MNVELDVNQTDMFQNFIGTITDNFGRVYEVIRTGVVAGAEFSKGSVVCSIAVVALASAILLEVTFRAILVIENQLKGTRFTLSDDICGMICTVSLIAMNYGLYIYCPLMNPIDQVVVSAASSFGYIVCREGIFG